MIWSMVDGRVEGGRSLGEIGGATEGGIMGLVVFFFVLLLLQPPLLFALLLPNFFFEVDLEGTQEVPVFPADHPLHVVPPKQVQSEGEHLVKREVVQVGDSGYDGTL